MSKEEQKEVERPEAKGPCWLVNAPENASDKAMKELALLFLSTFPQEVVGHVLVVRAGVCASELQFKS